MPFIVVASDRATRMLIDKVKAIYVPGLYRDRSNKICTTTFTAFARKKFFDDLAAGDLHTALRDAPKQILLCSPFPSAQPDWQPGMDIPQLHEPPDSSQAWPGGTVVMGIIDDGISFGHEHFLNEAGTRVQFYWRQDGLKQTEPTVDFGSELCRHDGIRPGIDSLLSQSTFGGAVDEDHFYHLAGALDFSEPNGLHRAASWRRAHGTHVLDLAAGAPRSENVTNRPIICVQLGSTAVADTTGALWGDKVKAGIDYIMQRANLLTADGEENLPLVINFSFGLHAGPHDGTAPLEHDFEKQLSSRPKTRMVLPSGNSHLSRCHATVKFDHPGDSVELLWRVQPEDLTPSWLYIWLPHDDASPPGTDRIKLTVREPGGIVTPELGDSSPGAGVVILDGSEIICLAVSGFDDVSTQRSHFVIAIQPTLRLNATDPKAPPGVWTINIKNVSLTKHRQVDAWVEGDDAPYGYPRRGRQSYLDDGRYQQFDEAGFVLESDPPDSCPTKWAGSINAIATGKQPIVIGGLIRKELRPAPYSAGGPITMPAGAIPPVHRDGPDALCTSDDSIVHGGVLAAGSRSGSLVAMNGTSVAAPLIARIVADSLATSGTGDRGFIHGLAEPPSLPAGSPPKPSKERGGAGRILLPHPYMRISRLG